MVRGWVIHYAFNSPHNDRITSLCMYVCVGVSQGLLPIKGDFCKTHTNGSATVSKPSLITNILKHLSIILSANVSHDCHRSCIPKQEPSAGPVNLIPRCFAPANAPA